jgi:predicted nucleic acid-binding protein
MIILDTNVISEAMSPSPSPAVLAWLDAVPIFELATTTINVAEIRYGLARLPFGRRRSDLEARFNNYRARVFESRVFGFDTLAADTYGELVAARERSGRPLDGPDGFIAAIAASRGLGVATRDIGDFDSCGLQVMNPWDFSAA